MDLNDIVNVPLLINWEQAAHVATAVAAVAAMVTAIIATVAARHSSRSTEIARQGVEDAQRSSYEERIHRYSSAIQQQGTEMVASVSALRAHLQAGTEKDPRYQDRTRDPRSLLSESLSHVSTAPGLLRVHINPAKRLSSEISKAGDELVDTADLTERLARWNVQAAKAPKKKARDLYESIINDTKISKPLKDFMTEHNPADQSYALQYGEYLLEKASAVLVKRLDAMESSMRTHAENWTP